MYDIKTRAAYCLLLWVLLLSHQEPAGGDQLDPGSEKHNFILYCATNQQQGNININIYHTFKLQFEIQKKNKQHKW